MGEHLGEQDVANERATVTARETKPNTTPEVDDVKGTFWRVCGGFFGGIFPAIVSFSDFFAFFGGFSGTKTTRFLSDRTREK